MRANTKKLLLCIVTVLSFVRNLDSKDIRESVREVAEFLEFNYKNESDNSLNLSDSKPRVHDSVWEGMVQTAWTDYITRLNKEKQLYGVMLEPLTLSEVLEDNIYTSQTLLGYQVELWMRNLTLHGLSSLHLEKLSLERSPGLTDVFTYALLTAPQLKLKGSYRMQGTSSGGIGWLLSDISSEVR